MIRCRSGSFVLEPPTYGSSGRRHVFVVRRGRRVVGSRVMRVHGWQTRLPTPRHRGAASRLRDSCVFRCPPNEYGWTAPIVVIGQGLRCSGHPRDIRLRPFFQRDARRSSAWTTQDCRTLTLVWPSIGAVGICPCLPDLGGRRQIAGRGGPAAAASLLSGRVMFTDLSPVGWRPET